MTRGRTHDRDATAFAPRITLTLLFGLVIFLAVALLWVLPVLLEEPPPGAIQDWRLERVRALLAGKALYLLVASLLAAAALGARGWLPGTGGGRRS
jgi:hypothetical protein